jgi:Family of unknown function (DUF5761)
VQIESEAVPTSEYHHRGRTFIIQYFFFRRQIQMTSILRTVNQQSTPLSQLFFSDFNLQMIQNTIRGRFRKQTGIAIDYQKQDDVLTLMRMVYINNSVNPYTDILDQVRRMNEIVITKAIEQINTGVSQYIGYMKNISLPRVPESRPINTSSVGSSLSA